MKLSPRFLPALCICLALALIPTWIHSYAGAIVTDGRSTESIGMSIKGFAARPSNRTPAWGKQRFDSDDWFERRYSAGSTEVVLTVIRSYDWKRLYHHPELDVAYGIAFTSHDVRRFPQAPSIPVHVLRSQSEGRSVAMYVLHHDNDFIADPLWFQLRAAGKLLVSGRTPMTLFFARESRGPERMELEKLAAGQVLFAAIDQFVGNGTR